MRPLTGPGALKGLLPRLAPRLHPLAGALAALQALLENPVIWPGDKTQPYDFTGHGFSLAGVCFAREDLCPELIPNKYAGENFCALITNAQFAGLQGPALNYVSRWHQYDEASMQLCAPFALPGHTISYDVWTRPEHWPDQTPFTEFETVPNPVELPQPGVWPAVDPLTRPLQPTPDPHPIPYPLVPGMRPHPGRSPVESPSRGNEEPGRPRPPTPVHPGMEFPSTGGPGKPIKPVPVPSRPKPGTKEKKLRLTPGAASALGGLINGLTESKDAIDAIHDALPEEDQCKRACTPQKKLQAIADGFPGINWQEAAANLAANQIEDALSGKLGKAAQQAARDAYGGGYSPRGNLGVGPAI